MNKLLKIVLRFCGVKQYVILLQTKKHRRAESLCSVPQYVAWIATFTVAIAKANEITSLALISEIKKAVQGLERKEE